jgi:hypothetical protein
MRGRILSETTGGVQFAKLAAAADRGEPPQSVPAGQHVNTNAGGGLLSLLGDG